MSRPNVKPTSVEPPILWIVAGPNGSGKSSSYQTLDVEASARSVWIINPDLLTVHLREAEGLSLYDANLQAVRRIEAWLEASIRFRVTKGGHAVPENKIVERYARSLGQLPWFLDQADDAWLYDNSDARQN